MKQARGIKWCHSLFCANLKTGEGSCGVSGDDLGSDELLLSHQRGGTIGVIEERVLVQSAPTVFPIVANDYVESQYQMTKNDRMDMLRAGRIPDAQLTGLTEVQPRTAVTLLMSPLWRVTSLGSTCPSRWYRLPAWHENIGPLPLGYAYLDRN